MSISKEIIKPENCVLAFGIPVTVEEFSDAIENPKDRDFIKSCCPSFSKYQREILIPADETIPQMRKLGGNVVQSLTLWGFENLFRQKTNRVIILFSHWQKASAEAPHSSVEFFDGMANVDAIVDKVPKDFDGFIDLCVCHPLDLVLKFVREREKCLVKRIDREVTPLYWLYFYWTVFTLLKENDISYLQALELATEAFSTGGS